MFVQELVTRAKAMAFLPNVTEFSDANVIGELSLAQMELLVPALLRANGEYFTEVLDVPADVNGYVRIPPAALASTARVISWVNTDGSESSALNRIELADIHAMQSSGYQIGTPGAFSLVPDGVMIYGAPVTGNCRIRYSRLPSDLCLAQSSGGAPQVWTVTVTQDGTLSYWILTPTPLSGTGLPTGLLDLTDCNTPYRLVASAINNGSPAGTITLSSVIAGNSVTINGVILTCVSSGASGQQFNVGASDTITAANLAACIDSLINLGGATARASANTVMVSVPTGVITWSGSGTFGLALSIVLAPVQPGGQGDALAARVPAGSFLTLTGTTWAPQFPKEWHNLFLRFAASRLAELRKDYQLQQSLLTTAGVVEKELINVSTPRTKQNAKTISSWRGHPSRPGRIS